MGAEDSTMNPHDSLILLIISLICLIGKYGFPPVDSGLAYSTPPVSCATITFPSPDESSPPVAAAAVAAPPAAVRSTSSCARPWMAFPLVRVFWKLMPRLVRCASPPTHGSVWLMRKRESIWRRKGRKSYGESTERTCVMLGSTAFWVHLEGVECFHRGTVRSNLASTLIHISLECTSPSATYSGCTCISYSVR